MNRIAQLAIITIVLLSAVSCNEEIVTDYSEAGSNITVTLQVKSETKAGYEGTSVLPERFIIDIDQNGNGNDYPQTLMKKSEGTTYIPEQNITMTWKDTDHSNVTIKAITSPDGRYDIGSGLMTIEEDQSTPDKLKVNDLLGASTANGITIGGNNINVAFNHLMSKLYVTYTKTASVTINSIKLRNVCTEGTYNYSTLSYGNATLPSANDTPITMYHNDKAQCAEAIFFPFTPQDDPELIVNVTISGTTTDIPCPVSLRNGASFIGGKIYLMNIDIVGTNVENIKIEVESWDSTNIPGERVLWIGTSIPAGSRYPEMVADALNCTVVNNSVSASLVIRKKNPTIYATSSKTEWEEYVTEKNGYQYSLKHLAAGALSQTHEEADQYDAVFRQIYNNDVWVKEQLDKIKSLSYESLIIPYINGEKDNCTTVILDHGFNDRAAMINEAINMQNEVPDYSTAMGYTYLMRMKAGESGYTYSDYLQTLKSPSSESSTLYLIKDNYIVELTKVIDAIKAEANRLGKDIRIIIGNYFTLDNPFVRVEYSNFIGDGWLEYFYTTFCSLICYFNETVAGIHGLQAVNVYNYIWLDDNSFPSNMTRNTDGSVNVPYDSSKFCPDGVHPNSSEAGRAIANVYINQLNGVIGSRD